MSALEQAKRLVIKIGSSLLVDAEKGEIRADWLDSLAQDVARLRGRGQEVLLVSSGAIAVGRRGLGLAEGKLKLEEKQAAAAAGQIRLAHAYQEALGRYGVNAAQVLLTLGDTEERRQYLNARSTLATLLRIGSVPVINENDTVATAEIRFGDNDRLAARVAAMATADLLVLLSDVDGLYSANPRTTSDARHIGEIGEITPEIEAMADAAGSAGGSGGMVTKLAAARICLGAGCHVAICRGSLAHPLQALEDGALASWFIATATPKAARKLWIAASLRPRGRLLIDAGAIAALGKGRSLLPAGVVSVSGHFERGDAVIVEDAKRRELARGLSAYSSDEGGRIAGHKSREIERLLGYRGRDEMIHRDDLVLS
jgi:glutamate 5-kinase